MYSASDRDRQVATERPDGTEEYRTPWRRDHARLIHCPSFRRLQGKTQVFAGHEGDFFRNRLTHSLEVAQIAKSIAVKLNATSPQFAGPDQKLEPDIVEFAGLAHDLGHPPFGHNGEHALDECMAKHGGFEGNAQTLRILSRLEKKETQDGTRNPFDSGGKDRRVGLNLTYRSLASVLKYDNPIPMHVSDRDDPASVTKGYYSEDKELVSKIKSSVLPGASYAGPFKTVECSIMDIADDIAYSTYDLEDVFKSGLLKPLDLFVLDVAVYKSVINTTNRRLKKQYDTTDDDLITEGEVHAILFYLLTDLFVIDVDQEKLLRSRTTTREYKKMLFSAEVQQISRKIAKDGYYRTAFISDLVALFLDGIEVVPHDIHPQLHKVRLEQNTFILVEVLKNITYEAVIRSPIMQTVEFRGKDIVARIFKAIVEGDGNRLLPDDFRDAYSHGDEMAKYRAVCDFIGGMTDSYALEFYSRLFGEQGLTMHKPL